MNTVIAWYAHHHGSGHIQRASIVGAFLDSSATLFTSADIDSCLGFGSIVKLPLDVDADGAELPGGHLRDAALHYAPLGSKGIRERVSMITGWIACQKPGLMVIDVSVEIARLARLTGTPSVIVRQHGDRRDHAHNDAYQLASGLLAPFPAALEDPETPEWIIAKTFYAGGFSRFDGRVFPEQCAARRALGLPGHRCVVVLSGDGGEGTPAEIAAAARACPEWQWVVIGKSEIREGPDNIRFDGWVSDPMYHLAAADVAVASGGDNTVMEIAAARRPMICIPQKMPFNEQVRKGQCLQRMSAAKLLPDWPAPSQWRSILAEQAKSGAPHSFTALVDGGGARRAAEYLERELKSHCG